jgi:hypothetical protein
MQKTPVNMFNNKVALDNTGTVGDNVGGWEYNEATGIIKADDNYDNDGVAGPDHANL